jgi:hypothetical protein
LVAPFGAFNSCSVTPEVFDFMVQSGWSFWVKQGTWRDVLFVAISDKTQAMNAVLETISGDAEIENAVPIPADVIEFLKIPSGKIKRAHVQ